MINNVKPTEQRLKSRTKSRGNGRAREAGKREDKCAEMRDLLTDIRLGVVQ